MILAGLLEVSRAAPAAAAATGGSPHLTKDGSVCTPAAGGSGEEKTCNYACAVTSEGGRWGGGVGEGLGGTAERAFSAQPGFVSLARTKNIHHLVLNASVEYLR